MSASLEELISLLALERLEHNLFRGQSQDLGWGSVYGGQVLGQALSAATQTVPADRTVHSLHGYFLRRGDPQSAIVYDVDRIRDGKSFTTRRVVAIQAGRPIFNLSCSFQVEESGFEHQAEMPEVAGPEGLSNEKELWTSRLHLIPERLRARATSERPIELVPVDPIEPFSPTVKSPVHHIWVRASGSLPDDPALHRYMLAYCSDFGFVTTALRPHARTVYDPRMQVASIDHAMWFHQQFRFDEWLLHAVESPAASGARGLARGQIFTRGGTLVASTVQEGLIRDRSSAPS